MPYDEELDIPFVIAGCPRFSVQDEIEDLGSRRE
jgi:hypothetical protein